MSDNARTDWQDLVGGDPWKNVLRLECKAVEKEVEKAVNSWAQKPAEATGSPDNGENGTEKQADHSAPEKSTHENNGSTNNEQLFAKRVFDYRIISNGKSDPSYLIAQTGRLFLVRPTVDSLTKARKHVGTDNDKYPHLHVVFLEAPDVNVLKELEPVQSESKEAVSKLTIWTSYWIWEQCACDKSQFDVRRMPEKYDLSKEPGAKTRVFVFGRNRTVEFTLGVKLTLSYTLSINPRLRAEFVCNNHSIVIDPALNYTIIREFVNSPKKPDGSDEPDELDSLLSPVRNRCRKNAQRHPELSQLIGSRYDELYRNLNSLHDGKTKPSIELLYFKRPGFPDPVHAPKDSLVKFKPKIPGDAKVLSLSSNAVELTLETVLESTVVVILCGGLTKRQERELIDVSYELDIEVVEDGKVENDNRRPTRTMSILEWRLRQLNAWNKNGKLPVLLLTTPDTESTVDSIVERCKEQDYCNRLNVVSLAAQLIAKREFVKEASDDNQLWAAFDGGWDVCPDGHLDALRCLWELQVATTDKTRALIVAHNNLGVVFDDDTKTRLVKLQSALAVELFQYEHKTKDQDPRWPRLSWATSNDGPLRLMKEKYSPDHHPPEEAAYYYSSLTWYVNLQTQQCDSNEVGYVFPNEEGKKKTPRRDMDMVTHEWHVERMPHSDPNSKQAPVSLCAHPRYLGVRTFDHIATEAFRDAFEKAHKPLSAGPSASLQLSDVPFLTAAPKIQETTWGGREIAEKKGLGEDDLAKRIGETWEISTLPQGRSSVLIDVDRKVPLNVALAQWKQKQIDQLPMIKYLDSHGPLSMQVHPNAHAANFLSGHDEGKKFKLRDKGGKDESFLVIQPGTEPSAVHLFLGFSSEAFEPIASQIRQDLERLPSSMNVNRLQPICRKLATALGDECKKRLTDFLQKDSKPASTLRDGIAKMFDELGKDELVGAVFTFHLSRPDGNGTSGRPKWELAQGLEYLFAGVMFIRMVDLLQEFARKVQKEQEEHEQKQKDATDDIKRGLAADREQFARNVRELFGETPKSANEDVPRTKKSVKEHPLLRFFTSVTFQGECCVRIPAGIVHSWQGGGNFLVEIAQPSDNTFRILDFGREFSESGLSQGPLREMHYKEAMYSLSRLTFLDDAAVEKLRTPILPQKRRTGENTDDGTTDAVRCHDQVTYRLYRHGTDHKVGKSEGIGFLLNPDGRLRVTADQTADGSVKSLSTTLLGRCGTLIVDGKSDLILTPDDKDDRVFLLQLREPRRLFCLSLGGTRWELAVIKESAGPAERRFDWWSLDGDHRNAEEVDDKLMKVRKEKKAGDILGIARSGYKDAKGNFYSSSAEDSDWDVVKGKFGAENVRELSDIQVGVLGEIHHPMGRLTADKPAMVVHIDRGICFGFYHPKVYHPEKGEHPKVSEKEQFDRVFSDERLTVCSAVGRWLYRDARGSLRPADQVSGSHNWQTALRGSVFCSRPHSRYGHWIRATKYFSGAGIIATRDAIDAAGNLDVEKFLENLNRLESQDGGKRTDEEMRNKLREIVHREHGEFLRGLEFVRRFASDLAKAICSGIDMLRKMANEPSWNANQSVKCLTRDDFEMLAVECPEQVVRASPEVSCPIMSHQACVDSAKAMRYCFPMPAKTASRCASRLAMSL